MNEYSKYVDAKQNVLDYINDRDKFNRVYYLIKENVEIMDKIINTAYRDFDYIDKSLAQTFLEHLKSVIESEEL